MRNKAADTQSSCTECGDQVSDLMMTFSTVSVNHRRIIWSVVVRVRQLLGSFFNAAIHVGMDDGGDGMMCLITT